MFLCCFHTEELILTLLVSSLITRGYAKKMEAQNVKVSSPLLLPLLLSLVLVSVSVPRVASDSFYIKMSPNQPCPPRYQPSSCMTLEQYINATRSNTSMFNNVSLEFESGTHTIRSLANISLSNVMVFKMYGENVAVLCEDQNLDNSSPFLNISFVTYRVNISGIAFIGCRVTYIQSATGVYIESCSFQDHGSVVLEQIGNVSIVNSTFQSGRRLVVQNSTLVIKESAFVNLTSVGRQRQNGSQPEYYWYTGANGGAIWSNATNITVMNSNFFNNTAKCMSSGQTSTVCGRGGAVFVQNSQLSVSNCLFMANRAALAGGAVYNNYSDAAILNSTFYNNSVLPAATSNLTRTQIDYGGGGAIFINFENTGIHIYRTRFIKNKANSRGGSLYVNGSNITVIIEYSQFLNNKANEEGGTLFVSGNSSQVTVFHSNFRNNSARFDRGGVIYHTGYGAMTRLNGCRFSNNSATQCAVMALMGPTLDHTVTLMNSVFSYNKATGSIGGGTACANGVSTMNITNCSFSRNQAATGHAGVLLLNNSMQLQIRNSLFIRNSAGQNGGVLYTPNSTLSAPATVITINESTFMNNRAGRDGGVMYVGRNGSTVRITNTIFFNNSVRGRGGVVAILESELDINLTTLYHNTATNGDVISSCNGRVTFEDGQFIERADPNNSFCSFYDNYMNSSNNITKTINPNDIGIPITSMASVYMYTISTLVAITPSRTRIPSTFSTTPAMSLPTATNTVTTATGSQNTTATISMPTAPATILMPTAPATISMPTAPATISMPTAPATISMPIAPAIIAGGDNYATAARTALGIAIAVLVLVLVLYVVVTCIIVYLCCSVWRRKERSSTVNNPYVYVPMKDNDHTANNETPS